MSETTAGINQLDQVKRAVATCLEESLGCNLSSADDFRFITDRDSLTLLDLTMAVNRETSVYIDPTDFALLRTGDDITGFVLKELKHKAAP
jgi:acyl carrier protein